MMRLLVSMLLLLACSTSPTEQRQPPLELKTPWGTALVQTYGRPFSEALAIAAVMEGYERATTEQVNARLMPLDGLIVVVEARDYKPHGVEAFGLYDPKGDVVHMRQGFERVIAHELGHRACHFLGKSCCETTWHSPGFDLHCVPIGGPIA
jgi:hypothetical protein